MSHSPAVRPVPVQPPPPTVLADRRSDTLPGDFTKDITLLDSPVRLTDPRLSAARVAFGATLTSLDGRSVLAPPRVVIVEDLDGLALHRDAWNTLALSAPQALASSMPAWVEAYLRHRAGPGQRWLCCFAYDGDELVGVLPVLVTPHPILRHWRPLLQTLRIGDYAPSGDILLASRQTGRTLRAFLEALRRAVPKHLGIDLQAVHERSPLWSALEDGVDGYAACRYLQFPLSYVDVTGDIETYLGGLGNLRRNLKRYRKKLEARGQVSVEIIRGSGPDEALLSEFLALEASGWKGRNGTAIVDNSEVSAFYVTLMRAFSDEGHWEWHLIRLDGRLIAAGFGIRCGPCILLPKIAFDETHSDCMPGNLLTDLVIRDAFSRPDIHVLNHMSLAKWHESWRMGQYEYSHVNLIRKTMSGLLFEFISHFCVGLYKDKIVPLAPSWLRQFRDWLRTRKVRRSKLRPAPD